MATLVYSLNANNVSSYSGSGSSWNDISGITYSTPTTCTLINSPSFIDATTYKYLQFTNASSQYGVFPMAATDAPPYPSDTLAARTYLQSWSMAMWIRLDSAPYVGGVGGVLVQALTSSSYTDPAYNFAIGCGGAGFASNQNEWGAGWLDRYGTGGAATWHVTSVTGIDGGNGYTLSVGNWHHVVATYEKTGTYSGIIRLYVDGQLRALTPNFDNSANATPGATFLNTKALRTFINRNWAVDVDDPRKYIGDLSVNSYQIYQGLLSDAEILALYNAGYFITTATPINWLSSGYALLQSDATNFGRYVGSTIYGNSDANLTFTLAMMEYNYRSQWGT